MFLREGTSGRYPSSTDDADRRSGPTCFAPLHFLFKLYTIMPWHLTRYHAGFQDLFPYAIAMPERSTSRGRKIHSLLRLKRCHREPFTLSWGVVPFHFLAEAIAWTMAHHEAGLVALLVLLRCVDDGEFPSHFAHALDVLAK